MNKTLILGIAIIGIGLFALPNTVSIFTGSHTWGDPKTGGVDCSKCHQQIFAEMAVATDYGAYSTHTPHAFMDENGLITPFACLECHTVEYNITERFVDGSVSADSGHTVTTVSCLACHGATDAGAEMHDLAEGYGMDRTGSVAEQVEGPYCVKCHDNGTGTALQSISFITDIDQELMDDGHAGFYYDMINDSTMVDANEACMGCHSNIDVEIEWEAETTMSFVVNDTGTHLT